MRLMLTGATGFVGRSVSERWINEGRALRRVVRQRALDSSTSDFHVLPAIEATTDWRDTLVGCDAVLHLAARVHIMNDRVDDPLAAFRAVNTAGTLNLACQAAAAGIRRFVFVSSIKVNGESTAEGQPFRADDLPHPEDPYGISKRETEDGLRDIAACTGMEVVIVRPPLVYGPGVKANFQLLMSWLQRGMPLPLGAVTHNRRSLVALDNLVDLLITCIDHPAAANQTFLVSDGEDLSTGNLLRRLGEAMGRPAHLLPIPPTLLRAGARALGRGDIVRRLLDNLQVDITHTRETLGWAPPVSIDEGLRRAAAGFQV